MAEATGTHLITCPSCGTANRVPEEKEGMTGKCGSCHGKLPPLYLHPVPLTDASFDSFVAGYAGPVMVEFWAPW